MSMVSASSTGDYWELETLAKVRTQVTPGVVQHWQLYICGRFIADTSIKSDADLVTWIAWALNTDPRRP